MEKITLANPLCPGDCLVMTTAIQCLHEQHKDKYLTAVKCNHPQVFEANPHVSSFPITEGRTLQMAYPLINQSNQRPVHFVQGYVEDLASRLGITLHCSINRPALYLTEEERGWIPQIHELTGKPVKYWLVCSGIKDDYLVKGWGLNNYQTVIDELRGAIQFVQVGSNNDSHPRLKGVIDMVGKTNIRQLIRMAWHAQGGLGGVSFLHHVFAAFEAPFVCVASGMEPASWERYNTEVYLTRQGLLPCCRNGGCWKKSVTGDCVAPVWADGFPLPKCMSMISPAEVVKAIRGYYEGGLLSY